MSVRNSLKTLKEYRNDPIGFISKTHQEQGHRVKLNVFGKKLFILTHPKDVLHVLKDHHGFYSKGRTTQKLKSFIGNGLITNEGDNWRRQHRLIRPMMNPKSVYEYGPKILETTDLFISELDASKPVNMFHEMNRLTWRIVLNTLFTQKATPEMDLWLEDILYILSSITLKTRATIPIPLWIPTPANVRLKKAIKQFDDYVYSMIEERRNGRKKKDLLQLLIDAQDEDAITKMSDLQVKDEIMTFLMAGHETITNTMTWTFISLSQNPKYLDTLKSEANEFFKNKNFEELAMSPWHSAVTDEVMRLWPPVWVFMRQAEKEDQIDSLIIPKKANVIVSPYLSHRSEDFWENPSIFYPERFLPESKKNIVPGSYYPFGLGPRACIGASFAGLEAKLILASFISHFEFNLDTSEEQTYEAGITLRPTNNIHMNLKRITDCTK